MSTDLLAMVRALDLTPEEIAVKDGIDESYAIYSSSRVERLKREIASLGSSVVAEMRRQLPTCTREVAGLLGTACSLIGKGAIETLPDWFKAVYEGPVSPEELTQVVMSLTSGRGRFTPGSGDVALFVEALDRDPVRMGFAAILAIEATGPTPEAVPALLRALRVHRLAFDAGNALARLTPDCRDLVPALTEAAKLRGGTAIYEGLGTIGGPGVRKTLIEALGSPLGEVRIAAAKGLGHCGTPDDAAALVALLAKEIEADPRREAVRALATLRGLDASAHSEIDRAHPAGTGAPTLLDQLKSPDHRARSQAENKIEYMKDPPLEAIPLLIDILNEGPFGDGAVRALIAYGPAAAPAVPALVGVLKSVYPEVRYTAVRALGIIGRPEAGDALLALLQTETGWTWDAAIEALAKFGYIESLLEALSRGGEDARGAVSRLLDLKAGYKHVNRSTPQVVLDALSRSQATS